MFTMSPEYQNILRTAFSEAGLCLQDALRTFSDVKGLGLAFHLS